MVESRLSLRERFLAWPAMSSGFGTSHRLSEVLRVNWLSSGASSAQAAGQKMPVQARRASEWILKTCHRRVHSLARFEVAVFGNPTRKRGKTRIGVALAHASGFHSQAITALVQLLNLRVGLLLNAEKSDACRRKTFAKRTTTINSRSEWRHQRPALICASFSLAEF